MNMIMRTVVGLGRKDAINQSINRSIIRHSHCVIETTLCRISEFIKHCHVSDLA